MHLSDRQKQESHLGEPKSESPDEPSTVAAPSIELVCRRLTMKFEPFFNIVVRYLLCRCVMWRATPSSIMPEMTLLRDAQCPRHNTTGKRFRIYADYSLPCDKDPYFVQQFGGYNIFWTLLYSRFPNAFERLNGKAAISRLEMMRGNIAYMEKELEQPGWSQNLAEDYWFELVDTCKPLPPDMEGEYLRVKAKRVARGIDTAPREEDLSGDHIRQLRKDFYGSTMGRELKEIAEGRWTGEPHWKYT